MAVHSIYGMNGRPVGFWQGRFIYDLDGKAVGQLDGPHVHKLNGEYVGELEDDMVLDKRLNYASIAPAHPGAMHVNRPPNRPARAHRFSEVFHWLLGP